MDVSILIVTYQCRDAARECLASIYEHTRDVEFEVIVLDNASSDGTAEMVRSEFPTARLLALDANLGFAAGVNRAAQEAEGEYLLLLNPDTLAHPGAVSNLVAFARRRPEHGIYGGRTLRPNGELDPGSCWGRPTLWSLFCFATMLTTAFKGNRLLDPESLGGWQRDTVREVGIVTGCLLLVSRALWEELEGFDLRFFMYGEDADFSLRARQRGLRPAITPDSVVTHEVGVSSSTRPDKLMLLFRGKVTLFRKHWPAGKREAGLALLLTGVGLRALVSRVAGSAEGGKAGAWRPIWRARREWLAGYPPVPRHAVSSNGAPAARVAARN